MNNNIFFKSVLRQPIRAFIISILIGAAAFAFVARATEFVVVRGELTRIEAFYRAVGVLSPLRTNNFTTDHDVTRALDIVEGSRHVAISDTRRFTQGVLAGRLNLAAQYQWDYFNPALNDIDIPVLDHYFIGFLAASPRLTSPHDSPRIVALIAVEELLVGDPSVLRDGDLVFTNELGQTTTIRQTRQLMYLYITYEEARLFEQGLWNPFEGLWCSSYGLVFEERALFRATPQYALFTGWDAWAGFIWYLRALTGDDGFVRALDYNPRAWGGYNPLFNVNRTGAEDLTFFVREADTTALDATFKYLYDTFALLAENQSTVTVVDTRDMTAMPRFTDHRVTRLLDTPAFPAGRFLTYEDYGRPVAVVPLSLAVRRGLHVGETFTITLRDNPRPAWIDTPTNSVWARGVENWWDNSPSGWWGMTYGAHENWRDFPTYELELTVVGVYVFTPPFFHNFTSAEIFIPAGVIPESFGWDDAPQLTGMYSFVLDSPRSQEAFMRETHSALYALGFATMFMPNGFEHLAAATDPIRMSITVNLLVFGVASALILAFVVFLYLRGWRKSVAIAQALGTPRGKVLRQLFTPVIVFWVPSMILGSALAWFFAISQAEAALAAIAAYEAEVLPEISLLLGFGGLLIAFVLAGICIGGYGIVRRPVLVQLQGGAQKRSKTKYIDPGTAPQNFTMGNFCLPAASTPGGIGAVLRANMRHSIRHIFRTPVKTALALLLASIFVFSLGWLDNTIRFTEAEVIRLWDTTVVDAEIFRVIEDETTDTGWPANISHTAWNAVVFSGFFGDAYLETVSWTETSMFMGVSHLEGLIAENTKTPVDEQLGVLCADMEIEFMPGFGPEDFIYIPGAPIPLVVRRGMDVPQNVWHGSGYIEYTQVIGVFDGGLLRAVNQFGEVSPMHIMPFESHHAIFSGSPMFYGSWSLGTYFPPLMTARFTINPSRNRDIDQLRDLMQAALDNNYLGVLGTVPLQLFIDDDVIHSVIAPMEQNLSLLRVLYPIAIGVAFLLALGLSLLSMLQNAKNAAIMRVLGKPRVASQVMLCAEQLMVCVSGVLIGILVLFIAVSVGVQPVILAGVYFGGAVIGSAIGAFVISMRAPLDLLQVRE